MKIAVIIIGKFVFDLKILSEITRCYDLSNDNTDLFIYNNCTVDVNEKLTSYYGNKIKSLKTMDIVSFTEWYRSMCDRDTRIQKWSVFKENCKQIIAYPLKHSRHVPFKTEIFFSDNKMHSPEQYYQLNMGINEVLLHESKNQFRYDFIMKIRLDFYLLNNRFGPNHYFTNTDDILLKNYFNLKKWYDRIIESDQYHLTEFRVQNYLYWRTTKYLGGQYHPNQSSYMMIENYLNDREKFNQIIKDKFIITINDAVFFGSRDNMIKICQNILNHYGDHYESGNFFWWTPESQLVLSILDENLCYFDYLQNGTYYKGDEMWVNLCYGTEKYDNNEMITKH